MEKIFEEMKNRKGKNCVRLPFRELDEAKPPYS
jgi:hypothetical protein